jgi:DNA-binding MarR family transcriptional regulator
MRCRGINPAPIRPLGLPICPAHSANVDIVCYQKGLCRSEIIERMIARVPDASRLLDRLETAELIARARDAEDRRFVTTRITDEGLRVLGDLDEPVMELHRQQFAGLRGANLRHHQPRSIPMHPDIAAMLFMLILVAMVGGFILLLPITRRLGAIMEQRLNGVAERSISAVQMKALETTVHSLPAELEQLQERQDFTDALLAERRPLRLTGDESSS